MTKNIIDVDDEIISSSENNIIFKKKDNPKKGILIYINNINNSEKKVFTKGEPIEDFKNTLLHNEYEEQYRHRYKGEGYSLETNTNYLNKDNDYKDRETTLLRLIRKEPYSIDKDSKKKTFHFHERKIEIKEEIDNTYKKLKDYISDTNYDKLVSFINFEKSPDKIFIYLYDLDTIILEKNKSNKGYLSLDYILNNTFFKDEYRNNEEYKKFINYVLFNTLRFLLQFFKNLNLDIDEDRGIPFFNLDKTKIFIRFKESTKKYNLGFDTTELKEITDIKIIEMNSFYSSPEQYQSLVTNFKQNYKLFTKNQKVRISPEIRILMEDDLNFINPFENVETLSINAIKTYYREHISRAIVWQITFCLFEDFIDDDIYNNRGNIKFKIEWISPLLRRFANKILCKDRRSGNIVHNHLNNVVQRNENSNLLELNIPVVNMKIEENNFGDMPQENFVNYFFINKYLDSLIYNSIERIKGEFFENNYLNKCVISNNKNLKNLSNNFGFNEFDDSDLSVKLNFLLFENGFNLIHLFNNFENFISLIYFFYKNDKDLKKKYDTLFTVFTNEYNKQEQEYYKSLLFTEIIKTLYMEKIQDFSLLPEEKHLLLNLFYNYTVNHSVELKRNSYGAIEIYAYLCTKFIFKEDRNKNKLLGDFIKELLESINFELKSIIVEKDDLTSTNIIICHLEINKKMRNHDVVKELFHTKLNIPKDKINILDDETSFSFIIDGSTLKETETNNTLYSTSMEGGSIEKPFSLNDTINSYDSKYINNYTDKTYYSDNSSEENIEESYNLNNYYNTNYNTENNNYSLNTNFIRKTVDTNHKKDYYFSDDNNEYINNFSDGNNEYIQSGGKLDGEGISKKINENLKEFTRINQFIMNNKNKTIKEKTFSNEDIDQYSFKYLIPIKNKDTLFIILDKVDQDEFDKNTELISNSYKCNVNNLCLIKCTENKINNIDNSIEKIIKKIKKYSFDYYSIIDNTKNTVNHSNSTNSNEITNFKKKLFEYSKQIHYQKYNILWATSADSCKDIKDKYTYSVIKETEELCTEEGIYQIKELYDKFIHKIRDDKNKLYNVDFYSNILPNSMITSKILSSEYNKKRHINLDIRKKIKRLSYLTNKDIFGSNKVDNMNKKSNYFTKKLNKMFKGLDIDEENIIKFNKSNLNNSDEDSCHKFHETILSELKPNKLNIIVINNKVLKTFLKYYYINSNLITKLDNDNETNQLNLHHLNNLFFKNNTFDFKNITCYLFQYNNNYGGNACIQNYYTSILDKKDNYHDVLDVLKNTKYKKFITCKYDYDDNIRNDMLDINNKSHIIDESHIIEKSLNNEYDKLELITKLSTIQEFLIHIQKDTSIQNLNNFDLFKINKPFYRISELNKMFFQNKLEIDIKDLSYDFSNSMFKLNYNNVIDKTSVRNKLINLGFNNNINITNEEINFEYKVLEN